MLLSPELRRALAAVVPYRRQLGAILALSLTGTAVALAIPYLTKDLVDRALVGRDPRALRWITGAFAALTAGSFGLNLLSGLLYTKTSASILFDMRLAMYRHLQRLSPRFYARTRMGDIVSRLNNDIGEIQRIAAETLLAWTGNVLFLIGTLGVMAWLDLPLFLISMALVPFSAWMLARYRRVMASRVAAVREASAGIGSFLIETLQAMRVVVTSNAQEREIARFRQRNDEFVRALMRMQLTSYLSGGVPGLILAGATAMIFLYGGQRVVAGSLTLGTFVAFMAYQMRLLAPLQGLMGLYASLATVEVSLKRVHEILDHAPEVVESPGATALERAQGAIELQHVTVSFDRGAPVLEGLTFSVAPGEHVALVGPSGSGKSTIADLLVRLIDPDSGVVRLDGRDLRTLRLADIRRLVMRVEQDPVLFHASIAENLRYVRPGATAQELRSASAAAGLDDFVSRLPDGLATIVGERGLALSSGERQRIAIARALLADPAVLVLDEPTSSLDPATERRVAAALDVLMKGRTTIVISHRTHLALEADRAVVLQGARAVQQGRPLELLEDRQGAFAALFERGL
ncbi:MAG: ABC transporter ATP-binding protein [Acidobacteria bacterium]|nr:ABC transporter ATP-binding protein [Acidobacteriota bacterium]